MKEPSVLEQDVSMIVRSVEAFQKRFGLFPIDLAFFHSSDSAREERILSCLQRHMSLLIEEVGEVSKAINHGDVESAIPELLDVLYVTVSTLYMMGDSRLQDALTDILEKNVSKSPKTHEMHPVTGKLIRKEV